MESVDTYKEEEEERFICPKFGSSFSLAGVPLFWLHYAIRISERQTNYDEAQIFNGKGDNENRR